VFGGVPQDISIKLLRESISSPIKVSELHHINQRMKTGSEIHNIPFRTVCLKFAGQSLPCFIWDRCTWTRYNWTRCKWTRCNWTWYFSHGSIGHRSVAHRFWNNF